MYGLYGAARLLFIVFIVLLIGMTIGGDGHQAAMIVSGLFRAIFHFPVFSICIFVGILIGGWLGQERAVYRKGVFEMEKIRYEIAVGGRRRSR